MHCFGLLEHGCRRGQIFVVVVFVIENIGNEGGLAFGDIDFGQPLYIFDLPLSLIDDFLAIEVVARVLQALLLGF